MTVDAVGGAASTPMMRQVGEDRPLLLPGTAAAKRTPQSEGERDFGAAFDIFNPLHHIPGVGDLYRAASNDEISTEGRQAGRVLFGLLLGGPVGLGAAMVANYLQGGGETGAGPGEPVDVASPGSAPEPAPAQPAAPVPEAKPAVEQGTASSLLLGQETGAATAKSGEGPLDLLQWLNTETANSAVEAVKAPAIMPDTAPGLPVSKPEWEKNDSDAQPGKPEVSGADKLAAIVSHKANHLPLDVLKTMQDRHAAIRNPDAS